MTPEAAAPARPPSRPYAPRPARWPARWPPLRSALRAVGPVAAMEVRRLLGARLGRTAWTTVALAALVLAALPLVADRVPTPDASIHAVAVEPGSPFAAALEADHRFRMVAGTRADAEAGRVALWAGFELVAAPDPPGAAALAAARQAVRAWTLQQMEAEADEGAAFPLAVTLELAPPRGTGPAAGAASPAGANGTAPGDGTGDGGVGSGGGTGGDGSGGTGGAPGGDPGNGTADGGGPGGEGNGTADGPGGTGAGAEGAERPLRPHELRLPLPGISLLLTFLYILPLNVIAQVCASGFLQERTRRRGVLALTTPVPRAALVAGRALPALALALAVSLLAGAVVGAGVAGAVASVAIVALPIAGAVALGVLARSERELTFLLTAAMTSYAFFLFLPAVFRAIPAVAYLSPLTVVVEGAAGVAVPPSLLAYAVVPSLLLAAAFAWVAWGAYRDEVLHGPLPLGRKVGMGAAALVRRAGPAIVFSALTAPVAFGAQMLVVAYVAPLALLGVLPVLALPFALLEEALKRIALAARPAAAPWRSALLVGGGFALGEQVALLAAAAGLGELALGRFMLALSGVGSPALAAANVTLHVAAAWIQAWGLAGTGRARRLGTFLAAATLHAAGSLALLWGGL